MARITYSNPDGSWGIKGVDLREILNPRVYCALSKLMEIENLIDIINSRDEEELTRMEAMQDLRQMGGVLGDGKAVDS